MIYEISIGMLRPDLIDPSSKYLRKSGKLTVMLIVDVSASGDFGTCNETKREIMAG